MKSFKSRGVSLIELSIVISVIGLLVFSTIGVGRLIDNARATGIISTYDAIQTATGLFVSASNGALPGDIPSTSLSLISNPSNVLISNSTLTDEASVSTTNAGSLTAGNGDGRVRWGCLTNGSLCTGSTSTSIYQNESIAFAYHLNFSNFLVSAVTGQSTLNTPIRATGPTSLGATSQTSITYSSFLFTPFSYCTGSATGCTSSTSLSYYPSGLNTLLIGSGVASLGTESIGTPPAVNVVYTSTKLFGGSTGAATGAIPTSGVSAYVANQVDTRIDDGLPGTGDIRYPCYGASDTITSAITANYNTCSSANSHIVALLGY